MEKKARACDALRQRAARRMRKVVRAGDVDDEHSDLEDKVVDDDKRGPWQADVTPAG